MVCDQVDIYDKSDECEMCVCVCVVIMIIIILYSIALNTDIEQPSALRTFLCTVEDFLTETILL